MKQWMYILSFICSFGTMSNAFAIAIDIPPGQWQCMAIDSQKRNYGGYGKSMRAAKKAAKSECKKRSNNPKSCKTAGSYCEQGPTSLIEDRCIVSDESGRTWNTTGQNACQTARYLCQQWQYLHGSTRSVCTIRHRMKNYDGNTSKEDDTFIDKLFDFD